MFLLDISFRQVPGRSQVIKLIIYQFSPWRIISWFLLWFDLWFYDFHDLCQEPIKFDGLLFMSFMINLSQPGRNASKKGSSSLSHGPLNAPCLTLPPKKKIGSNHCFQFLLGITVISGEIEDNGYAQGALWSMWKWWIYSFMVENFGFFVYPKWHKIQLLLQRLEVTFKNASNVTWLTWTWPL